MKKRLDILVYEKGFTDSREKAKAIIMSGQVYVDNQKADKCGTSYDENVKIEVRGNTQKYVSRGGLKLEKAIDNFDFDLKDKITMDIGASTGGFTDCMLQNGAKKVYSIDVGYGQLAEFVTSVRSYRDGYRVTLLRGRLIRRDRTIIRLTGCRNRIRRRATRGRTAARGRTCGDRQQNCQHHRSSNLWS